MKCPFKHGDQLKCVNKNMQEWGDTAYVDSIGDETENGWEVTFFGGGAGYTNRGGIVNGRRYDTADFAKFGAPVSNKKWIF